MTSEMASSERAMRAVDEPNVRWYVVGNGISAVGSYAQAVSLNWLILRLGGGGAELGIVNGLLYLPLVVLGPWAGVLADRVDRRRILVWSNLGSAVVAGVLGALTSADAIELWMVYGLAVSAGALQAVSNPSRHSFIAELVKMEDITSAVSVNNAAMTAARALGPALSAVLIPAFGVASSFYVDSASYLVLVVMLWLISQDRLVPTERVERKPGQVREGVRYVLSERRLAMPLLFLLIVSAFGIQSPVVLPVLTEEVFGASARTYAVLTAVLGAGTVIGSLGVARFQRQAAQLVPGLALLMGVGLIVSASAPNEWVAVLPLLIFATAGAAFVTLVYAILQIASEPTMRGRVMALFTIAFVGAAAGGAPIIGGVVELAGPRAGWYVGGVVVIAAAAVLGPRVAGGSDHG